MHDLLGFYPNFRPWFAKCYIPQVIDKYKNIIDQQSDLKKFGIDTKEDGLNSLVYLAVSEYISEVKTKQFPLADYTYPIKSEELGNIQKSSMWKI
jgi:ketopantoate hydroxymethyltransferase